MMMTSVSRTNVLVFGSQALAFDEESMYQLRSVLRDRSNCSWMLETFAELPSLWKTASEAVPSLHHFSAGGKLLEVLQNWLRADDASIEPALHFPLPNTLLIPLVVISHLLQYSQYLEFILPGPADHRDLPATFKCTTETLGICTGLLSAAAVSCSANPLQLQRFGAVAIRLAMLIGTLVDAQDRLADSEGESRSFSIAWSSSRFDGQVSEILKLYPQAYVSVVFDENRATITASKSIVLSLQQELETLGVSIAPINLRGRFHHLSYGNEMELLLKFCDSQSALQFPDASELLLPTRSNTGGDHITNGKLHHHILRSMLVEQSDWHQPFTKIQSASVDGQSQIVSFDSDNCVPYSLARRIGPRYIQLTDLDLTKTKLSADILDFGDPSRHRASLIDNGIAVVGMACQLPGAADLEEFWRLLCTAKSQHIEVPSDRFSFETAWREVDPKRKWYGNFVQDYDTFDHKFFKKSPREMASTDPQHRLMLQIAYQAVEQSGYFNAQDPGRQHKHIGCYISVGLVDYENNIACAPANAYSATGNLKSFAAGKISHYFGWTGPSLTVDTACSSSAVAVHLACRAILSGECTGALAGGVNLMTSPEWFQNLAGASFLSLTGQCKPFDIKGDGYCRGEGVGAVFLKKLSSAIADGDQILGVIGSSVVYQNQNCTPITVPNALSLSDLFSDAVRLAGLEPKQVSYVEAHGTGTPVGDPAEYDGIRKVLGGSIRQDTLSLGSVKGLIGHTESASGIVALLKILLMIQEGVIPPQASFDTINQSINASPLDKIEIAKSTKPWDSKFRAALINNYGASGSNASLVVTQGNKLESKAPKNESVQLSGMKHPFWFCGIDEQSLRAYSARFRKFLNSNSGSVRNLSVANLAFQVSRQSNRSHGRATMFSCSSVQELEENLTAFERGEKSISVSTSTGASPRPVILCFGGQVSTYVGLDRQIYDRVTILRYHLDQCNAVCQSIGLDGIYPEIFQRSSIKDIIKLQTTLFAMQYSCAKSWIDCGVQVTAVIGFSFGELTALSVSGVLSLQDAVKMIAGRARLIQKRWDADPGAMLAVEADLVVVERLLAESNKACVEEPPASIACFNGPTSFTLAGSAKAIDMVAQTAKDPTFSSVKSKKLNVTNAFHTALVEPLMADLERLGQELEFHEPKTPFERATEFGSASMDKLTARFVADQMRNPVYFSHAVQRLSQRYPGCIWLEAGSTSTITKIASRALGAPKSFHFQPINITGDDALSSLSDATVSLWREGLNVSYWSHHSWQGSEYKVLLLPPYQFEKTKHWIERKDPPKAIVESVIQPQILERPKDLWTFIGYQDKNHRSARFRVNTSSQKFENFVSGHIIAQSAPLCPSTLQLSIAIAALMSLDPASSLQPQIQGITSHALMSIDPSRSVWLDVELNNASSYIWDWKMTSTSAHGTELARVLHVSGRLSFRARDDPDVQSEFAKYERLVDRQRCQRLLDDTDADELLKGSKIYKRFAEIVEYADLYKGVQKLVGKSNKSAGRIVKAYNGEAWLDTGLADSFCQVAGIFVNCMTDRSPNNIYISNKIDQWIRSPALGPSESRPEVWEVLASHHRPSDRKFVSDVFIFDPRNGALLEVILGIHYQMVSKTSLSKAFSRLTFDLQTSELTHTSIPKGTEIPNGLESPLPSKTSSVGKPPVPKKEKKASKPDISGGVRDIIVNLSGLEHDQIKDNSDLVELGIDSLMAMELTREVETAFKCTLQTEQMVDLTDFRSLVTCIQTTLNSTNDEVTAIVDLEEHEDSGHDSPKVNGGTSPINSISPLLNGVSVPREHERNLPATAVLEAFKDSKQATDWFISEFKMGDYVDRVLPKSTELCVAHIVEAFEKLGCSLGNAKPGQKLNKIQHLPRHEQFVDFIYDFLGRDARLIDVAGAELVRTAISPPKKSAQILLQDLIHNFPDHSFDHELTYLIGAKLAECLTGKDDAIQIIFGSQEGRRIATRMYGKSPINIAWVRQMEDFLRRLLTKLPVDGGPIKILEMGAGTGGATAIMIPLLASLHVPVRYTITDISASLVASARKRFKDYSFVDFRVFDIEKSPAEDLLHSQHIVIATNCVHATHSLEKSTKNIHDVLRQDGLLMMLEMTQTLPWVDLIFGLLEGWWLFNDGRRHAIVPPSVWEQTLTSVGYGHVDWTEGSRPEANVQRVIIALASGSRYDRAPVSPKTVQTQSTDDFTDRQAVIDACIQQHTRDFTAPVQSNEVNGAGPSEGEVVLVTGATGSLGSHIIAHLAELPKVRAIICLNRYSSTEPELRQHQALRSRGISLDLKAMLKLRVVETDTARPMLGLPRHKYENLVNEVTQIIHNAWPMSITRGIKGFASQFKVMQNLIELARDISCRRPSRIGFQFISSIATVGNYPLWAGIVRVPEERMTVKSVLPTGYGDAKLVCERMLDETLHKHPSRFRSMAVRIGQISGSTRSGYWNPVEHFAFLIKSSHTLKVLPKFEGDLSWCPVTEVAATLGDLLMSNDTPYPIYHIENPARQSWHDMMLVLADVLDVPRASIIPFEDWVHRVRQFPGSAERDNPAANLIEFLDRNFIRMSCGGLILDTAKSREHSETLRSLGPVTSDVVRKYVYSWKNMGFLHVY